MSTFTIAHWNAWAPGIEKFEQWQLWAETPYTPLDETEPPRLEFLPALQRRRLSKLARMVFACAYPIAEGRLPMPMVFASQHGETSRSFALLNALAREEALSPTSFGLSVHNAIIGLWSIVRQETTESVAITVADDGLESAMLEAGALLNAGAPGVIVVLAEERPPSAYRPWIDDAPFSYAIALHITPGDTWRLTCLPPVPDAKKPALPHPLSLLRHLTMGTQSWAHDLPTRTWMWTRLQ